MKPTRKRKSFNRGTRYPFIKELAREFGISTTQVQYALSGERESSQRGRLLARQAELLNAELTKETVALEGKPQS